MNNTSSTLYPVLPLRDIVVFPNMIVPLFVGRYKSIKALESAEKNQKEIKIAGNIKRLVEYVMISRLNMSC